MNSLYQMPENEADSRLRWRCRRGMLELDLILNNFIDREYVHLNNQQKQLLDQMLDYPDQLLFDLFLGFMQSADKDIASLVSYIRKSVTT
ncbi:MAG: succinate dehydrogenase assembly factor 2 [Gammaproteobacteria bacterium]|nr:succinate dehydrogenase assembly factor 2 [Gammaproteobacteria bacterium]MDH5734949.1 succinate dehydrogenase assembly factor 2 [Gammaproteobacteria bacterium]